MSGLHTLVVATRDDCLLHHDLVRIHGYCARCPNFGKRWSCPPFSRSPLEPLGAWSHAVLVARKVMLDQSPATNSEARLAWALERFHASRAEFRETLLAVEGTASGSTALVAGHCANCAVCTRLEGAPCRYPELMRTSLEAAGFDVSSLTADLLGVAPQWPSEGLPEYYLTVGAILCPEADAASEILACLDHLLT